MEFVLITGASQGFGKALALYLAKKKHSLILHYYNNLEKAEEVASLCRKEGVIASVVQGDFSSPVLVRKFILKCQESYPSIYALINNVGPYHIGPLTQTSEETWEYLVQMNVTAPFLLTRGLPAQRIINMGVSGLQARRANSYCAAYRIAKSALWEMTLSLAKELTFPKTVNMVSPGILENSQDLEQWKPAPITPYEEVAKVIAFLLEKENSHITGQNIEVAAGFGL